ncbi:hypothetical protein, variant [Verruconis gallopava]|uniref:Cyclin-domain-containing protein n=1 Tax=Verruconis gallopava TaxID=253628 RepID=A0A0D2A9A8_9PEZI|nr:uncharacterized protein PV09_05557 [Verruconis gallopava]XP_016213218.1 hypothetical protein, variant [Verruconis gallopava]KIW03348.1 hypothetical protein PV09_05557 [Verruconis gallopava]KIW03349.1 hypothetical protein, variant [Verruconis gallopava]
MTSIVVSEVHHHLPYAHPHHQHLHDVRTSNLPHHPYKHSTQTNAPPAAHHSSTGSSMDTPMIEAASHEPSSNEAPSQPPPSYSASLAPPPSADAHHGSMNPPRSPRFKGQLHSTPRAFEALPTRFAPSSTSSAHPSPHTAQPSLVAAPHSPAKVKVKSLSHIQSFVLDEHNPLSQAGSRLARQNATDTPPQYEISEMPVTDIIEMVAGLLTKITTTNDKQHQHLHRQIPPPDGTVHMSPQTTSVLAFHGKNVPTISILSYLSRIHKYCPTTYEVFLSLLVYFDRMTERVNAGPLQSLKQQSQHLADADAASKDGSRHSSVSSSTLAQESREITQREQQASQTTPPPSGSLGQQSQPVSHSSSQHPESPPSPPRVVAEPQLVEEPYNFSHFFVVDSYNIHRLVIAGVTCASKFFSDIFYTNSRYAKVGGLPLPELNHLELQFLLLNDFRLAVPLEEMEAYGTMLVEFYAREVLANQNSLPSPSDALGVA